mmetsp:Transcript_15742/g.44131  ORF Transcript_15742/g.44131 Transcript_15742/m.44131 type:complete len:298 (-) Transcript_15742:5648-6541(-)
MQLFQRWGLLDASQVVDVCFVEVQFLQIGRLVDRHEADVDFVPSQTELSQGRQVENDRRDHSVQVVVIKVNCRDRHGSVGSQRLAGDAMPFAERNLVIPPIVSVRPAVASGNFVQLREDAQVVVGVQADRTAFGATERLRGIGVRALHAFRLVVKLATELVEGAHRAHDGITSGVPHLAVHPVVLVAERRWQLRKLIPRKVDAEVVEGGELGWHDTIKVVVAEIEGDAALFVADALCKQCGDGSRQSVVPEVQLPQVGKAGKVGQRAVQTWVHRAEHGIAALGLFLLQRQHLQEWKR